MAELFELVETTLFQKRLNIVSSQATEQKQDSPQSTGSKDSLSSGAGGSRSSVVEEKGSWAWHVFEDSLLGVGLQQSQKDKHKFFPFRRKQNEDWGVPEKRNTCFLIRRKQDETGGPPKKTLDPFEGSTRRLCFHQLALDAVAHPFLARTCAREEGPLAVLGGWPQGCPKASYAEEPLGQPPFFIFCSACQG